MKELLRNDEKGQRKMMLAKLGVLCFTVVMIFYFLACVLTGTAVSENAVIWGAMGYGALTGSSFWANTLEHKYQTKTVENKQE